MKDRRTMRVLVAKPGLDGHERGAHVIAYGLRDAGFEVIYTGLRQTPDQIVHAAIQEGVDVVGLSILSGAHLSLTRKVSEELHNQGAGGIMLLLGGVIPEEDIPSLKKLGVERVFVAGTSVEDVVSFIRSRATELESSGEKDRTQAL